MYYQQIVQSVSMSELMRIAHQRLLEVEVTPSNSYLSNQQAEPRLSL